MKKNTEPKGIVIHHYPGDNVKCKLPDPEHPNYEERYTFSRNDGKGDNPVKTVPFSKDGRGLVPKDSPLLRGHSSGEASPI